MGTFDPVKKAILAGLGALSYTQEKVAQIVDDLAERGEITREQAAKVVKEFTGKASKERDAVCEKIATEVRELLDRAPIASRTDLETLQQDLASLRAEVDALRQKLDPETPPSETGGVSF